MSSVVADQTEPADEAGLAGNTLLAYLPGVFLLIVVGVHRIFRAGVQTYEFWLKLGIVALDVRFVLGDVVKLGGISLVQILLDLTVAMIGLAVVAGVSLGLELITSRGLHWGVGAG